MVRSGALNLGLVNIKAGMISLYLLVPLEIAVVFHSVNSMARIPNLIESWTLVIFEMQARTVNVGFVSHA